ncbi:MAG: hypothetical protein HRU17_01090 [Polyangiaceae bacterium]|nr:hypothetical protein [Polyangiaceae bacterium]
MTFYCHSNELEGVTALLDIASRMAVRLVDEQRAALEQTAEILARARRTHNRVYMAGAATPALRAFLSDAGFLAHALPNVVTTLPNEAGPSDVLLAFAPGSGLDSLIAEARVRALTTVGLCSEAAELGDTDVSIAVPGVDDDSVLSAYCFVMSVMARGAEARSTAADAA